MQGTDDHHGHRLKHRAIDSHFYLRSSFILGIGITLFLLGGFMVTDIHNWQAFGAWLPLSLLLAGVLLLSSKIYSVWLGLLFIALGGLIWFHDFGMSNFESVTRAIDWMFVIVGGLLIFLSFLRIGMRLILSK